MTDAFKEINPIHFGSDTPDTRIRINPEIWIRMPDYFSLAQPKLKESDALGVSGVL